MKKLFRNSLIIVLIVLIAIIAILQALPKNENNMLVSLQDKHKYLEESTGKRIIFVGGSNLLFGLNSKMIEQEFKEYDVINMGLHAGLGLRFIINDIKDYIKTDDIVVIVPEYQHFVGETFNGSSTLNMLIKESPNEFDSLDINNIVSLVSNLPEFLRGQIAGTIRNLILDIDDADIDDSVYNRNYINNDGDMVSNLVEDNMEIKVSDSNLGNINESPIEFLNDFYEYATEKGVEVYMSYPSLYNDQYKVWESDILNLVTKFNNELKIPRISKVDDYIFDKQEMFDTVYHLNSKGKERRSMFVARDLKLALGA